VRNAAWMGLSGFRMSRRSFENKVPGRVTVIFEGADSGCLGKLGANGFASRAIP